MVETFFSHLIFSASAFHIKLVIIIIDIIFLTSTIGWEEFRGGRAPMPRTKTFIEG